MSVLYKKLLKEDVEKVSEYFEKKKLEFVHYDIAFYAVASWKNEIEGAAALTRSISFYIEPLAAESPIIAQVLLEKCLAVASMMTDEIAVLTDGDRTELISALEKSGFEVAKKNITILKRRF